MMGGPIGAIIGFIAGIIIDKNKEQKSLGNGGSRYRYTQQSKSRNQYRNAQRPNDSYSNYQQYKKQNQRYEQPRYPGDFLISLLVLVAATMKADGVVKKTELSFVKDFFIEKFGEDKAAEAVLLLRDIIKQNIPVSDVSYQIRDNLDYHSRLQLLHFLFGIGNADGEIHATELQVISDIYKALGISIKDYNSIKSMFVQDKESPYTILGVEKTDSSEIIKKAYYKMAQKYHPDKLVHLGDEFQEVAKEKFQKVNEAYAIIKKQKGID